MRKGLLVIWLLAVCLGGWAQGEFPERDSLLQVLEDVDQSDSIRALAAKQMVIHYIMSDQDSAVKYNSRIIELVDLGEFKEQHLISLRRASYLEARVGNTEAAYPYIRRAIRECDSIGDRQALAESYDFLAQIYRIDQRIEEALSVYDTVLTLVDTIPDTSLIAQVHFSLGQIQMEIDYAAAKHNLLIALELHRTMPQHRAEPLVLYMLGENAQLHESWEELYQYAQETKVAALKFEDIASVAGADYLLGIYHEATGSSDSARHYFDLALSVEASAIGPYQKAQAQTAKGRLCLSEGQVEQALLLCQQAHENFQDEVSLDCQECLYQAHLARGDSLAAFGYLEEMVENREAIFDARKAGSIAARKVQLTAALDSMKLANLLTNEQVQREQDRRQTRWLLIGAALFSLLAIGFTWFAVRRYRVERQQKQVIERQQTLLHLEYRNLKEFTENASHEMQTPMAIIQSNLERLFEIENLGDDHLLNIESAIVASARMADLNTALLLLTKIENSQFPLQEEVDFRAVVDRYLHLFADLFEAKAITLHPQLQEKKAAPSHPFLIDTLISNLISNAIRHNVEGGSIWVTLSAEGFTVKNNGKPLKEDPELMFQRFKKGGHHKESTGLGLAMVQKCCQLHGWEVSYQQEAEWHTLAISF